MILNFIWIAFFVIAFVIALIKLVFFHDTLVFSEMVASIFDASKTAFEISIGLTGLMTLWLGIMKIGESSGLIRAFSRLVSPFFGKLFPEIPKDHPALGNILMNFSANMLGLDNAATPLGLKAMNSLQDLNPVKDTASNAQIMFLVLNTAGLTLIPVNVMLYRAQAGAADPSDVFIPILLATFFGTLSGLLAVSIYQRINLLNRVLLSTILIFTGIVAGITWYFSTLSKEEIGVVSSVFANLILVSVVVLFIIAGFVKKINVYETFIEGAKDGFNVAIKIIPYLVAILVGIAVFRTAGAMQIITDGLSYAFAALGFDTSFVPALPTGLMKSLSGSGAKAMMFDVMKPENYGPDSFVGRLVCVFQGSSDTTFYILAVYFGSVGIKKTRYALTCGLLADFFGIIAAIAIAYLFFG
jgi:spore maturation protein SpmA